MTNIDDLQKIPAPNRQNRPQDGAYGEGAALTDLEQSLPGVPGQGPGGPPGTTGATPGAESPVTPVRSSRESNIPGVPRPLLEPSDRPDEPVSTPPSPVPTAQVTPAQRRLAILDQMANSPDYSEETREWAQEILRVLVE